MTDKTINRSIRCIPFDGIENAYVVISAGKKDGGNGVQKGMSFFFDNGGWVGAEWEPDYGPITVLYKVKEDHEKATHHWFYGFTTGQGNWSQCAVEEEGLPQAFLSGDYELLFAILKNWSIP